MLLALTRAVSPKLATLYPAVDVERARQQHAAYADVLRRNGVSVRCLDFSHEHGDSCFIEDTAVVVDEVAVLTTMGAGHRREEPADVAPILGEYRRVERLADGARLEGGDVLRTNKDVYVGLSARTNRAGVDELRRILAPHGYRVTAVEVLDGLHLKTACTALDSNTLLANRDWVDVDVMGFDRIIDVDPTAVSPRSRARARKPSTTIPRAATTIATQGGSQPNATKMIQ